MKLKAVGKMQTRMARSTSSSRTLVFVLVAFVIYIVIYLVVGGESDEDGDIVSDTPLPVRIVKAPKAAKPMSQSEDVTIRLNIMIGKAARTAASAKKIKKLRLYAPKRRNIITLIATSRFIRLKIITLYFVYVYFK